MGIFSRLGDIINSNINSLLDKAENPEKMIRNIIQEMEDTLVEIRTAAAKAIAEKKHLQRRIEQLSTKCDEWDEKAQIALNKNREDLAKAALLEKNKLSKIGEDLRQQFQYFDEDLAKHNEDITHLQEKLADARKRQTKLVQRHNTAQSQRRVQEVTRSERLDRMAQKMEVIEQKADRIEADAESHHLGKHKTLADEIDDLETDDQVTQELEALKAKMNKE